MIACQAIQAEEFLGMITKEFLIKFKKNIVSNFKACRFHPCDTHDFDNEETWINLGGTIGWDNAFAQTCREMNLPDLREYYNALTWFDSDTFDGDISDLAIEYGVIKSMPVMKDDETEVL